MYVCMYVFTIKSNQHTAWRLPLPITADVTYLGVVTYQAYQIARKSGHIEPTGLK